MRDLLNSGKVGKIELNAQKKIREEITNRWKGLGLLEDLEGHMSDTIAALYENEAHHLLYEATAADNSGSFETVVFPLIRRVFSRLLANDIVSVQAMNMPVGKLFYILPVTSEREWTANSTDNTLTGEHRGLMGYTRENRNTGELENRYYLPDDVVNSMDTPVTTYMKKSLYDLFYNDFLFDNSKGKVTIKVGSAYPVVLNALGEVVKVDSTVKVPTNPLDGSVSGIMLEVSGFSNINAGRLTGPDGNEMDTEAFLASLKVVAAKDITDGSTDGNYSTFAEGESIPFRVVTQKYGQGMVHYGDICTGNGKMLIEVDLTKPVKKQGTTVNGYIGANPDNFTDMDTSTDTEANEMFRIAWAEYDSLELETEMGEVSFQLTSVTVSVEERKLRATWSPELAQDVSAFHNIDAEAELTAILSEQVAAEIDREILRDLRKAAPWTARWDYNGWQRLGTTSTVYTQKDWNQTLITKVNMLSAQIQKSTLRGGANYVVVSAEISAVLNDLEYFHVTDASAESMEYNMGIEKIGSINGRYQVIVDPYAPHWSLIMGHHGTSLLDTGYIYAPYIPMALTPTMYNPFNFAPVKGIVTRYAKKMVNNRYFASLVVDGLVHFNINELR